MKKNNDRKTAEKAFLQDRGRITNKELSEKLGVHPATIARWKKIDDWDRKLVQSASNSLDTAEPEHDGYSLDAYHLRLLNERLDYYLQKRELLPSEILELAEAKYNIMACMEIINDQEPFNFKNEYDEDEDEEGLV